jgi:hypothetical protein
MAEPGDRRSRTDASGAAALIMALAIAAYTAFSVGLFSDGDTSWHLAAGKLILENWSVPDSDPFSYTFKGQPWVAHEWLAEVLMAAAYAVGSWSGLALLFGAAMGTLLLIMGLELRRWLALRHMVIVLVPVLLVLVPFTLARPHVLAWPLLAGWTILLLRAREAGRAPPLPWALLMIAWANLHGSFVMGLVLTAAFALEALVHEEDRRGAFARWSLFGAASAVCALLTPHGIHGFLFPLQVSAMKSLPLIYEWRRTDPAEDWFFVAALAAMLLLLLVRRPRMSPVRMALLAGLVYLSIAHLRHQAVIAILAPLLLAGPLAGEERDQKPKLGRVGALFGVGMLLLAAIRLPLPFERKDSQSQPGAAIERLPAELKGQRVLNTYGFGGPLIMAGIAPFIDGRADMYGDDFKFEHQRIVDGDRGAFARAAGKWGISWTILAPDEELVAVLDRTPSWKRIYADRWAVVHVRTNPPTR